MNAATLKIWEYIDDIYYNATRLQYVDKYNNIFRIAYLPFHGKKLITSDGYCLKKGDYFAKIHIHNVFLADKLKGVNNETKLALIILKEIRNSLPGLVQYLNVHPDLRNVKVLAGSTMLHRGAKQLGFDVTEMEYYKQVIKSNYLKIMLWLMHPDGRQRLKFNKEKLIAKYVYISKKKLFDLYG